MKPIRLALLRAMALTLGILGALALVSVAIAWGANGSGSAGAAALGVGVAAFVGLSTQAAMLLGSRYPFSGLLAILLGSFIVKALVLIAVFLAVDRSSLDRTAFALPLVVGVLATLVIDVVAVSRIRVPYVTPRGQEERG